MYPVTYEADNPGPGRNRLTTFFRYLIAIPILIVVGIYGIGAYIAALIAWFSIVFTGRYPDGLYDFVGKFVRLAGRTGAYLSLATDEYPPFNGDDDPSYPVRIGIPAPLPEYDRVKTGLRLIIGLPVLLLNYVQGLIASVIGFIAWFAILFTGELSEGLFNPLRSALAYQTRAGAYLLLLTEDYPPFSFEESAAPAGQIPASQQPAVPPAPAPTPPQEPGAPQ